MIIIGLTGGIGSGKSVAQHYIASKGIPVIDADQISKEIVMPGAQALIEIVDVFGSNILNNDGSLNRKELGNIVFSDKEKLDTLNDIMHKKIINEIKQRLNHIHAPIVVIDAALLIETELYQIVNEVWVIDIHTNLQIERVKKRDNLSKEEIMKRIKSQLPREKRNQYADVIIDNSGTYNDLYSKLDLQLKRLQTS